MTVGSRVLIAGIALSLASSFSPAAARERTVAAVGFRFVPQTVTIEMGDTLTFVNADPAGFLDGHNVSHDVIPNRRLFASATINVGQQAPVEGAASLQPGLYPFLCTLHPGMTGTLQVVVTGQ